MSLDKSQVAPTLKEGDKITVQFTVLDVEELNGGIIRTTSANRLRFSGTEWELLSVERPIDIGDYVRCSLTLSDTRFKVLGIVGDHLVFEDRGDGRPHVSLYTKDNYIRVS